MSVYDEKIWSSRYGPGQPTQIEVEFDNALDMFKAAVERNPNGDIIRYFDGRVTLRELDELSDAFALGITEAGFALNLPSDGRLVFALPHHGRTLVGTTEVRQTLDDPITCSSAEREYLVDAYNTFFVNEISDADIETTFAGVRPLVDGGRSAHAQRRGETIEVEGRVVSVFGGKWTTSRLLGERVADAVRAMDKG